MKKRSETQVTDVQSFHQQQTQEKPEKEYSTYANISNKKTQDMTLITVPSAQTSHSLVTFL